MNREGRPVEASPEQRFLKRKGLIALLTLLSAFIPLSTDLYLPALPTMTQYFQVPEYQTNLTLIVFFVFYSIALLVWGPLSDRFGRRPVLIVGLSVYVIASILCALSQDVFQLMAFRVLQSLGAGGATAVATAIVKDAYIGRKRESVLALVQSMVVISPIVAPVLGALLLNLMSWRGTFLAMGALGAIGLLGAIVFQETLANKLTGSVVTSMRRLGHVLSHRTFRYLLLLFAPLTIPAIAFISASSYVYQDTFGVSEEMYGLFFAIYAVGMVIGPQFYMLLSRRFGRNSIIMGCVVTVAVSGLLAMVVGELGPWPFILALLPGSAAMSCIRPPLAYLMLDQHEGDAGSASALMGSSHMVMGSLGMIIVSMDLAGKIFLIGLLNLVVGGIVALIWQTLMVRHLNGTEHHRG